uniref:ATP synthase F0 subunit 8 n=1 Tax=Trachytettix bufo TaxID=1260748 RepID=M4JC45_9ORTH|nr:ATP synthase F0 subunit 8 [Trachytettix bufo]
MPQMGNLWWLNLMIMVTITMLTAKTYLYYMTTENKNLTMKKVFMKNKMMWKW